MAMLCGFKTTQRRASCKSIWAVLSGDSATCELRGKETLRLACVKAKRLQHLGVLHLVSQAVSVQQWPASSLAALQALALLALALQEQHWPLMRWAAVAV